MKKLMIVVAALAMALSFLPKAEAGDTAQLGLTVAFDLGYPKEIDVLAKAVADHAFDINGDGIINIDDMHLAKDAYMKAIEYQAYLPVDIFGILDKNSDGEIDEHDWNLVYQEVRVYWIRCDLGQLANRAEKIYLDAVGSGNPEVIKAAIDSLRVIHGDEIKPRIVELREIGAARPDLEELTIEVIQFAMDLLKKIDSYIIRLLDLLNPIISIELVDRDGNPVSEWLLEGIRLGEKRENLDEDGIPIHVIRNTGNVAVMSAITYGPRTREMRTIDPGLEQGVDAFITAVYQESDPTPEILPPGGLTKIAAIGPGEKAPLHLLYGAPTALSQRDAGHRETYELRAYGMIRE